MASLGGVEINGMTIIGRGCRICVEKDADIVFGERFTANADTTIICHKRIKFGADCLLSWDVQVMDSDWHKITPMDNREKIMNPDREISFGDHVWVGCRSNILKGSKIPNNSIIASGSIVTGSLEKENAIYGGQGNGFRLLKECITWE